MAASKHQIHGWRALSQWIHVNICFTWFKNMKMVADIPVLTWLFCSAICPDFFVGKEPWSPSHDWSTFQQWLEDKKPTDIKKYKFNKLNILIWYTHEKTKQSCHLTREVDVVLKYLKEQCGVKHIGVVGFCWGGVATHYIALQYQEIKAGVSVYGNPFVVSSWTVKDTGNMWQDTFCNIRNCKYKLLLPRYH